MRLAESLIYSIGEEMEKKAKRLLIKSIRESQLSGETCLVDIDGFNFKHMFSQVLIQVGIDKKMTVVLGRGWGNPFKNLQYDYIYKESEFREIDPGSRPNEILISDGVDFEELNLGDSDKIVSGFISNEKYQKRVKQIKKSLKGGEKSGKTNDKTDERYHP